MGERVLDPFIQVLLELDQTRFARERFVVAEEGEDHVGLALGQPIIWAAEIGRAQADGEFVAGEAEIAEDEIVLRQARMDECFEPAVVLHAVGRAVADDADMVAGVELERLRGGGGGGGEEGECDRECAHGFSVLV